VLTHRLGRIFICGAGNDYVQCTKSTDKNAGREGAGLPAAGTRPFPAYQANSFSLTHS